MLSRSALSWDSVGMVVCVRALMTATRKSGSGGADFLKGVEGL